MDSTKLLEYPKGVKGLASVDESTSREDAASAPTGGKVPEGYEGVPPELWPDASGNPPALTPQLMKRLRGKYFTVKHPRLTCGHKLDMINQPKNNCGECWFAFFSTHPQLVEVAHQFYQTQGRGPMVGMRGSKFVKMFERFMATMFQEMKKREQEAARVSQEQNSIPSESQQELSGETPVSPATVETEPVA
jgi:hypothetical protein